MSAFSAPIDIANRAFQSVGAKRTTNLATDPSKQVAEFNAMYSGLRRAEMRRNVWRFSIRRVALRAVGTPLPAWSSAITYAIGSLVSYNNVNYVSIQAANLNMNPATQPAWWSVFTGNTSQKVTFAAWAIGTTYAAGAIVTATDGLLYLSMAGSNLAHDPATDDATHWTLYFGPYVASAWAAGSYYVGELVFDVLNAVYYSTENNNANAPSTGIGWATVAGTLAPLVIPWPAGTGPATDAATRNVFVLPYGFLVEAPQSPHAGDGSVLGFPSNLSPTDWLLEGGYLTSTDSGPIPYRFCADVSQVSLMDDMFCELLAARIALALCETLTQSGPKLQALASEYRQFAGDARVRNGIETGSVQPPLDSYITVRF